MSLARIGSNTLLRSTLDGGSQARTALAGRALSRGAPHVCDAMQTLPTPAVPTRLTRSVSPPSPPDVGGDPGWMGALSPGDKLALGAMAAVLPCAGGLALGFGVGGPVAWFFAALLLALALGALVGGIVGASQR